MKSDNDNRGDQSTSWHRKVLKQIESIKIGWLLTFLLLFSIILYVLSFYLTQWSVQLSSDVMNFLSGLTKLFADGCLSSAIIGFGYEWLVRKESEENLSLTFGDKLKQSQMTLIQSFQEIIPQTLLLDKEVQKVLLVAVDKLDEIMKGVLSARLGDTEMGSSLYDGLLQKTLEYNERYIDMRHEITLSNLPLTEPEELRNEFFDVIVTLRYRTKLRLSRLIFTRVTDHDQFNLRIRNPEYVFSWRLRESDYLPKDSEKALKVLSCKINDIDLIMQQGRISDDGAFEIVCEHSDVQKLINQEVTIHYSIQTKLSRLGHIYFSNAIRPTKNVTIQFNWARTDIETVRVYDFFVSAQKPTIYMTPPDQPHTMVVEIDEWVFPKGGAAFVWKFKGEEKLQEKTSKTQRTKENRG